MTDQIQQLVDTLKKYDESYFNTSLDSEVVDDSIYDNLRNKLILLDPTNPYLTGVGSDVRSGKEKLPYSMGSLNQVHDDNDIANWISKYDVNTVVISDKEDGYSCLLVFNAGKFYKAYSRGNGVEGADVTRNVNHIKSIPVQIDPPVAAIRGEIIIKTKIFDQKYSLEFKNSRNMVSGIMNRKIPDESTLNDFDFLAYEIIGFNGTKEEEFEQLMHLGFKVPNSSSVDSSIINDQYLAEFYASRKIDSEYLLDGLVITTNNYKNIEAQSKSSSLNPEHSVKYKNLSKDAYKQVSVVDVLWELSKSGYYKPRIKIVPTEMSGTTVTYATGFHAQFIKENGIGPGAIIEIVKAGEIIPRVMRTIKAVQPKMPPEGYVWNSSCIEAMVPDPDSHPDVKFNQILDFFVTLKIDLLKEANLHQVFDSYKLFDKTYEDILIFIIEMLEAEWVKVIGSNGSKIYKSLEKKLSNLPPEEFLGSLKYFGVGWGVRKSKMLLTQCENGLEGASKLSVDEIVNMAGFDYITANSFIAGIDLALRLLEKLSDYVKITEKKQVSSDLSKLNVVLTGFRDATLQEFIEMNGGKVGSGVSKKTTHLICASVDSGSSKYKKAQELGVQVITLDEFKEKYL